MRLTWNDRWRFFDRVLKPKKWARSRRTVRNCAHLFRVGSLGCRAAPMPEDETTPSLAPAATSTRLLSPLHLPGKVARQPAGLPDAFDLDGPLSPNGKAAASALFVLSGSRAARAPLQLAVPPRRPQFSEEEEEVRRRRRPRRRCARAPDLTAHAPTAARARTRAPTQKTRGRIRSSRCGTCANCLRPDCGECIKYARAEQLGRQRACADLAPPSRAARPARRPPAAAAPTSPSLVGPASRSRRAAVGSASARTARSTSRTATRTRTDGRASPWDVWPVRVLRGMPAAHMRAPSGGCSSSGPPPKSAHLIYGTKLSRSSSPFSRAELVAPWSNADWAVLTIMAMSSVDSSDALGGDSSYTIRLNSKSSRLAGYYIIY